MSMARIAVRKPAIRGSALIISGVVARLLALTHVAGCEEEYIGVSGTGVVTLVSESTVTLSMINAFVAPGPRRQSPFKHRREEGPGGRSAHVDGVHIGVRQVPGR